MADAVTSTTLLDSDRLAIIQLTNTSDGTGESAVVKVDVSALQPIATGKHVLVFVLQKLFIQPLG